MDPKGMKPPMPEGMGMPPMMQQMMQKMMEGMKEFNKAVISEIRPAAVAGGH
jgi:hypothetical protein